uniref:DDE_Tnp_IS1595 domain-containing protein n=1 Tax=Strongyloides venezuelensis TaxID=75913 RepID=A0A0K0FNC4_STRVS
MEYTTRFSDIPSMFEAFNMFGTPKLAEKILFDNGIFSSSKHCPKCGNSMSLNGQSFRCCKKTCRAKVTVRDGTFFSKMKAPLNVISSATNAALHKYSRQLIAVAVNECDVKIGGPWIIVEIDESKFRKRKHHRGHRAEGAWVLGGVELTSERKLFVQVIESKDAETLLPIIQQHVLPGYIHEKVNHSLHFHDPVTGVHTHTIEGTWLRIKLGIPLRCRNREVIDDYLWDFIWHRINKGRRFEALIWTLKNIQWRDSDANTVPMDETFGLLDIEDGPEPIVEDLEADGQHHLDNTEQLSSPLALPVTKKN